MTVELIYLDECPNVSKARTQLLRAFGEAGLSPRWIEWEQSDAETPVYAWGYASPTILVDGKDVAGAELSGKGSCCRLYVDPSGGFSGVPAVETIAAALRNAKKSRQVRGRRGWWRWLALVLGAVIVVVGKFAFDSPAATYGGVALLVAASLWNTGRLKKKAEGSCPACAAAATAVQQAETQDNNEWRRSNHER